MAGEGRKWPLILGIVAGLLLLAGICCCGGVYLGMKVFESQAKAAFQDNPVVAEHLGEIQDMDLDLVATGEEEEWDVYVYRVQGSKGSGVVTAKLVTVDADTEEIVAGTLRLPSGETFELVPADVSEPDDEEER